MQFKLQKRPRKKLFQCLINKTNQVTLDIDKDDLYRKLIKFKGKGRE